MVVPESADATKQQLRRQLLERRADRSPADRLEASHALCDRVLAIPEVASATRLACYASLPDEPGTPPLLAALSAQRCEVLLPLLQPDLDLDWAVYEPQELRSGTFGIREPTGHPLGPDAVQEISVVICPALAADRSGNRLGRGGGSFDRALGRLGPAVLRIALVYDDEVLDVVPSEKHDQRVHLVVTPSSLLTGWCPSAGE